MFSFRRARLFLSGGALTFFLAGCGAHTRSLSPVRGSLLLEKPQEALQDFSKTKSKTGDLLAALEHAHLLRLAGDYRQSNAAFERAERIADDLYTRSLTKDVASFLISDKVLDYRPPFYEAAMIPFYRALNYLDLNQPHEALVEARKAAEVLSLRQNESRDSPKDLEMRFFLETFSALLFFDQSDWNNAVVSLRRVLTLWEEKMKNFAALPDFIPSLLYVSFQKTGQTDLAQQLKARFPKIDPDFSNRTHAVLFAETGFVPYKVPVTLAVPVVTIRRNDLSDEALAQTITQSLLANLWGYEAHEVRFSHLLTFSFPKLRSFPSLVRNVSAPDALKNRKPLENTLDLENIAQQQFKDDLPERLLKTIARVIAKDRARVAAKKESSLLGTFVNFLNVTTEQADTRSWVILPAKVYWDLVPVSPKTSETTVDIQTPFPGWTEKRKVPLKGSGRFLWGSVRSYL